MFPVNWRASQCWQIWSQLSKYIYPVGGPWAAERACVVWLSKKTTCPLVASCKHPVACGEVFAYGVASILVLLPCQTYLFFPLLSSPISVSWLHQKASDYDTVSGEVFQWIDNRICSLVYGCVCGRTLKKHKNKHNRMIRWSRCV